MDYIGDGQVTSREEKKEWKRGEDGGNTRMKMLFENKTKTKRASTHRKRSFTARDCPSYPFDTILNINVKLVGFRWAVNPIRDGRLKD
ncbi:hypothetical protein AAGW04_04250 [Pectobacterium aroidearum]|uniref:hypothetical protein n=1 Tax=Pectobacterium aroidearum TaxID=1201031 RepID=UPI0031596AE6